VIEKPMVTGQGQVSVADWGLSVSGGGAQQAGVNTWAVTDTPPEGVAFFGCNCKDPGVTWDNTYGQWWQGKCYFGGSAFETFLPPSPSLLVPSQQSVYQIYPFNSGGIVQVLMCDASVRTLPPGISVQSWSAGVTPRGGETATLP
jgi:hypothetical protein